MKCGLLVVLVALSCAQAAWADVSTCDRECIGKAQNLGIKAANASFNKNIAGGVLGQLIRTAVTLDVCAGRATSNSVLHQAARAEMQHLMADFPGTDEGRQALSALSGGDIANNAASDSFRHVLIGSANGYTDAFLESQAQWRVLVPEKFAEYCAAAKKAGDELSTSLHLQ